MAQKKHDLYSRTWGCDQEKAQLLLQHKHQATAQQWLHPTASMARGLSKVQLLWSRGKKTKALLIIAWGENSSSTPQDQQTWFESITHYSTSVVDDMAPKACQALCGANRDLPAPKRLPFNSDFTVIFQKHREIKALLSSPRHSFSLVEHISIHKSEKQRSQWAMPFKTQKETLRCQR